MEIKCGVNARSKQINRQTYNILTFPIDSSLCIRLFAIYAYEFHGTNYLQTKRKPS